MKTISVHGAPSEYILQVGILQQLETKLIERGFEHVLIVHGEKSWNAAKPFWPVFTKVKSKTYKYNGECSLSEVEKVYTIAKENTVDTIIGVGGGKVLDLVKAAAHKLHQRPVLIPTLASNCAPWTPLSVLYDEDGSFVRFTVYPESASLVLVDPQILINSPVDMFIAGIGDTLAKWYEADVQIRNIDNKPVPIEISYFTAKQCRDTLLHHAEDAIYAMKNRQVNDDFIKVTETIIMTAGMVGGFGDHYGRSAAAHSIHNGLTALEETHNTLHGEKVAYGILIQLVIENNWDEIEKLLPIYKKIGLPVSLKDIGVENPTKEDIQRVAEKAVLPEETIHVLPDKITADVVTDAILTYENKYVSVLN